MDFTVRFLPESLCFGSVIKDGWKDLTWLSLFVAWYVYDIIGAILWWIHPQKITLIDVETYALQALHQKNMVQNQHLFVLT